MCGSQEEACVCVVPIYIYIYVCAHVDKSELDKYTRVCTLFCVRARVETPLWCLQKAVFPFLLLLSLSLSILSSLFFIKKGGEKKREKKTRGSREGERGCD